MKPIYKFLLFILLNFAALAIGSWLMNGSPAENEWYISQKKSPLTPPGWVFGAAWTIIMVCFAGYMANLLPRETHFGLRREYSVYGLQWILNVVWNPVFFALHEPIGALFILVLLFLTVSWFLYVAIHRRIVVNVFLILPYFVWLILAGILNGYILLANLIK